MTPEQRARKLAYMREYRAKHRDDRMTTEQRERKLAYMREYNAKHRDEHRAYNRQWYQDHKEEAKAAARQYRLDNPEKAREASLRWREENKEYLEEYNKAYQELNQKRIAQNAREKRLAAFAENPKTTWLHYAVWRVRGRAKKLGLPCDKDLSGLHLPDTCPVLGIPLNYRDRRKHPAPDSPSIDRVVPARGYVISNIRVISWRANALKRDASIDEIRRVLSYVEECLALEETC